MLTIVASWDARSGEGRIHLSLDSALFDADSRQAMAQAKVHELEALQGDQPVEFMIAHARTLSDFRRTDPRFYDA